MENIANKRSTLKIYRQEKKTKDLSNTKINTDQYSVQTEVNEGKYKLTLTRMLDVNDKNPVLKRWN